MAPEPIDILFEEMIFKLVVQERLMSGNTSKHVRGLAQ